jgi:hypothetical protein
VSIALRRLRCSVAVIAVSVLCACGGGGGGDTAVAASADAPGASPPPAAPAPASPQNFTYGNGTVLPGRLAVTSIFGTFVVYDLATGAVGPTVGDHDSDVWWEYGQAPHTLVRWDDNLFEGDSARLVFFDTRTLKPTGTEIIAKPVFRHPKLSADGRYLMATWANAEDYAERYNNPMTIVEVATGNIVKRDWTLLDGEIDSVIGSPVDWLPDNSYIFLDGRQLYRATLDNPIPTRVATLDLPDNSSEGSSSLFVNVRASHDGRRFAFTWSGHIWVANVDGTGLHRITDVPADSLFGPSFGSPSWSPDSQWISATIFRDTTNVVPVFPDVGDTIAPAYEVVATTGCVNPVFVLHADSAPTAIDWPRWPTEHGVRVRRNGQVLGLTTCNDAVHWIP